MPLVLRNSRLGDGRQVDITVDDGRIVTVADAGDPTEDDAEVHDLEDWLVVPAMAEPHAHLDKALTAEQVPNPTNDLNGAINAWVEASTAGAFSFDDTRQRATRAMELLLISGVTAVRTHVNVSSGIDHLRAVREAGDRLSGLLDVQVVALPSNPMTGPEGRVNRIALDAAIEVGVDLVGGCPHLDPDGPGMIAHSLAVAVEAGVGLDLHVDEMLDPTVLTLRDLARQVVETGFEHPVTASHCVTLGMQEPDVQASVAREVAEAGIGIITLPHTNLFLQGRNHPTATPRGLTALAALKEAGVQVAAGADNVQDPFNLVGRSDPLETAALLVMAGHQTPDEAYRMVAEDARALIGYPAAAVRPGATADLMVIDAPSVRAAIADAPASRRVYRRGVLVASVDQDMRIHRP
ncbi:MAG: amidohydrolase family protein [Actinomycetota bacterium]|nr:amidohydrolase family protein [Actinomycetota bacterium]